MSFSKYYVNGQTGLAENWTLWFGDFFSDFIGNGFTVTEDTGLKVNISAGRAYIKDTDGNMFQIISNGIENVTLPDDDVNYLYLHCDNGSDYITIETTPENSGDDILIGIVETESGAITSITNPARTTPLIKSQHIFDGTSDDCDIKTCRSEMPAKTVTQTFKFNPMNDRVTTIDNIIGTFKYTGCKRANCSVHIKVEYNIEGTTETFFDDDLVYNTDTNIFDGWEPISNPDPINACELIITITLNGYTRWVDGLSFYEYVYCNVTDFYISYYYQ